MKCYLFIFLLQNGNVLSAVLCLIKELDYTSLEVAEMAIRCRMDELEDWGHAVRDNIDHSSSSTYEPCYQQQQQPTAHNNNNRLQQQQQPTAHKCGDGCHHCGPTLHNVDCHHPPPTFVHYSTPHKHTPPPPICCSCANLKAAATAGGAHHHTLSRCELLPPCHSHYCEPAEVVIPPTQPHCHVAPVCHENKIVPPFPSHNDDDDFEGHEPFARKHTEFVQRVGEWYATIKSLEDLSTRSPAQRRANAHGQKGSGRERRDRSPHTPLSAPPCGGISNRGTEEVWEERKFWGEDRLRTKRTKEKVRFLGEDVDLRRGRERFDFNMEGRQLPALISPMQKRRYDESRESYDESREIHVWDRPCALSHQKWSFSCN